ncbi:MAG: sigma-70 family RNA polymerase sigma factor [Bacteroidia bacterium]|nr:sigma-70 family RNA polymerase sigma factor [Bacteroidia bacterium]
MNLLIFQRLVRQIQNGDDKGLQYVFDETNRYCVRTLIKKTRCDTADAEDIFMDAMLIFRENILSEKLIQLTNIKTYMFGICWNLWRDLNRAKAKWGHPENETERQVFLIAAHDPQMEEDEKDFVLHRMKEVKDALSRLGEKCRQLLTYVYVEERSQKEIAEIMNFASPEVVKVTRHRCYQQWMKHIEQTAISPNGK